MIDFRLIAEEVHRALLTKHTSDSFRAADTVRQFLLQAVNGTFEDSSIPDLIQAGQAAQSSGTNTQYFLHIFIALNVSFGAWAIVFCKSPQQRLRFAYVHACGRIRHAFFRSLYSQARRQSLLYAKATQPEYEAGHHTRYFHTCASTYHEHYSAEALCLYILSQNQDDLYFCQGIESATPVQMGKSGQLNIRPMLIMVVAHAVLCWHAIIRIH